MGSGYNWPSVFPVFAGCQLQTYTSLDLPRPWVPGILGQLFNHSVTGAYGGWNGYPKTHCIWFHNGNFIGGQWIYVIQDEFAGDHISMDEATFMADWYGTLVASAQTGQFTPYT